MKKLILALTVASLLALTGCSAASGVSNAAEECGLEAVNGTIHVNLYPDDQEVIDSVACVLYQLDAPRSIAARLDATRAVDGTQTADWGSYSITWSYDALNGMTIIIEPAR